MFRYNEAGLHKICYFNHYQYSVSIANFLFLCMISKYKEELFYRNKINMSVCYRQYNAEGNVMQSQHGSILLSPFHIAGGFNDFTVN